MIAGFRLIAGYALCSFLAALLSVFSLLAAWPAQANIIKLSGSDGQQLASLTTRTRNFSGSVFVQSPSVDLTNLEIHDQLLVNGRGEVALLKTGVLVRQKEENTLPSGELAEIVLTSAFPGPGIFQGDLKLSGKLRDTQAPISIVVRLQVNFQSPTAADVTIVLPEKTQIRLPFMDALRAEEPHVVLHAAFQNKLAEPIDHFAVQVLRVVRTDGKSEYPLNTGIAETTNGCDAPNGLLKPTQLCRFTLQMNALPGPGKYRAELTTTGAVVEIKAIEFSIQRAVGWLFLMVMAGTGAGWLLQYWKAGGVNHLRLMGRARSAQEALLNINDGMDHAAVRLQKDHLKAEGEALMQALREGEKGKPEVKIFQDRVLLFPQWVAVFNGFHALPAPVQDALRVKHKAIIEEGFEKAISEPATLKIWAEDVDAERKKKDRLETTAIKADIDMAELNKSLFVLKENASSADYAKMARWIERCVWLVSLAITCAAAYLTIYEGKPEWGTPSDLIIAILFGMGIGLGSNTVLTQLLASNRMPQIT